MNNLTIDGNWNELKGKLRQQYAMLTDQDLEFAIGKKEELLGRLETKLGKTKEQLQELLSNL